MEQKKRDVQYELRITVKSFLQFRGRQILRREPEVIEEHRRRYAAMARDGQILSSLESYELVEWFRDTEIFEMGFTPLNFPEHWQYFNHFAEWDKLSSLAIQMDLSE